MNTLVKAIVTSIVFLISYVPFAANCQVVANCKDVHDGIFYAYPKNSNHIIEIERKGNYDKETDLTNGDFSIWNTVWKSDCESVSKYISGNAKMSDELKFLSNHKLVFVIQSVTENYYSFKGYADKIANMPIQDDTIWLHKKLNADDNRLFEKVSSKDVKKLRYTDTSKYALLYIYRPSGRFKFSSSNFLVYFDNNTMFTAKNNSGLIFKILKEGTFEIKSKYTNDESSVKLDVKFGNSYYVKSAMVGALTKKLNNFKLTMTIMTPADGKGEFEEVDLDN